MKVLLVEDEERLAESIKKGLEREGYSVDLESDGEEALSTLEIQNPEIDIVILDVNLPSLNGFDLCKKVRKQKIPTPVIMLTARSDIEDKVFGLDCGADDYLTKPFKLAELLARMRALLRRPKVPVSEEIKIKDLVLVPSTKRVFRRKKEVTLTPKEFALLEYMVRNPGIVLAREQIISNIWDFNFDSFSNLIDVHIRNLRKKIDEGHREELIQTVRGHGYRLGGKNPKP